MTRHQPGLAPEHMYEMSYCNAALEAAGLDIVPPATLSSLSRTWPGVSHEYEKERAGRHVAPLLKEARKAQGFTQVQIANLAGVSNATVCRYERGDWQWPYSKAHAIADVLGIDLDAGDEATYRNIAKGRSRHDND